MLWMFTTGLVSDLKTVADSLVQKINDLDVKKVVTECADCYRMLKVEPESCVKKALH